MTIRRPLQKQLLKAWDRSIETDYCTQRINSERSLQASFWAQLNNLLPVETRRMFIEPRFSVEVDGSHKRLFPDIVICNSLQVIAVIELKYLPRTFPRFDKDMATLEILAKHRDQLTITNSRFRGATKDARAYPFSDSVLFVWAGVHRLGARSYRSRDVQLLSDGIAEFEGCFMQLHAETVKHEPPQVFERLG